MNRIFLQNTIIATVPIFSISFSLFLHLFLFQTQKYQTGNKFQFQILPIYSTLERTFRKTFHVLPSKCSKYPSYNQQFFSFTLLDPYILVPYRSFLTQQLMPVCLCRTCIEKCTVQYPNLTKAITAV